MKILHTSDWHVGKTLRGRSRADEHRAVLHEIAQIARRESVDIALVVGDLFDTAAPSPEAESIVYTALLELANTGAHVAAVAGNHDNARRLAAVAPVFQGVGQVSIHPMLVGAKAGGILTLTTAAGETANVALLPFLSQRYVVTADLLMAEDADVHTLTYADRMKRVIESLCSDFRDDAVNLVVAHCMCTGGVLGGGERLAQTIFDYFVSGTSFPAAAHYVALGHLHRPQSIAGPCPIWYCGSPLQLDFGETENESSVLLIDARPGLPAKVDQVPLSSGRRLRTVRGTLADLQILAGTAGDDYLRVMVREQASIGLADEVRRLLPNAVDVIIDADEERGPEARGIRREGRSPHDLFVEFLDERNERDDRLVALFDELCEVAHAAD